MIVQGRGRDTRQGDPIEGTDYSSHHAQNDIGRGCGNEDWRSRQISNNLPQRGTQKDEVNHWFRHLPLTHLTDSDMNE